MLKMKLTSKRQATFPARVCESLGIAPGDEIILTPRESDDGSIAWLLQPARPKARPWLGSLREYAKDKDHSMKNIRESIHVARSASSEND